MNILEKGNEPCCGCGVCKIICPKSAIEMRLDEEGFYNPAIDNNKCIQCGVCVRICPKFYQKKTQRLNNKNIYAGETLNTEIKKISSSGGIGYELALAALKNGYYVIGVAYNIELNKAQHCVVKTEKDLEKIQGSKYLQSFTDVLSDLNYLDKENKYMIFGTPCQIKGLRCFIKEKGIEERCILIDVFCRGVPSYLLWEQYLLRLQKDYCLKKPVKIVFRDKRKSWHSCSMLYDDGERKYSMSAREDWFYKMYTSALCFRESCYFCNLKLEESYSDIRLGDFWGERFKEKEDGISIVIANTEKGKAFINKLNDCRFYKADMEEVKRAQKYIYNKRTKKVDKMRKALVMEKSFESIYHDLIAMGILKKVIVALYRKSPEQFKNFVRRVKKQ